MNIDVATFAINLARSFEKNQVQNMGEHGDDRTISSKTDHTPQTRSDSNNVSAQALTPPENQGVGGALMDAKQSPLAEKEE